MVTLAKIQGLDFETIEDYFEYITDSIMNGQRKQAQTLYKNLSEKQKTDFLCWHDEFAFFEEGKSTTVELIKYLTQ